MAKAMQAMKVGMKATKSKAGSTRKATKKDKVWSDYRECMKTEAGSSTIGKTAKAMKVKKDYEYVYEEKMWFRRSKGQVIWSAMLGAPTMILNAKW